MNRELESRLRREGPTAGPELASVGTGTAGALSPSSCKLPGAAALSLNLPPVILASQSPRRVELLSQILDEFEVTPSYTAELDDERIGARRLCEVNAQRKAFSVAERFPEHLVIGADTLVFLDGEALGKPGDLTEARAMLGRLAGRVHEVITGVCLIHRSRARAAVFSEVTYVKFRSLSESEIVDYTSRVDTLDKAGAYAIQEHGDEVVERIEGSHSNVVGLPVEAVRAALARWSI